MKIGILTFHFAVNYGAVMQAWALCTYLRRQGHDAVIVDYNPRAQRYPWWLIALYGAWRKRSPQFFWRKVQFRRFIRKHLVASNEACDAYIVGSDQVWNIDYFRDAKGEFDGHYFLGFVPSDKCRISYAASIGEGRWAGDRERLQKYLVEFDAISVREPFAKKVLMETGFPNVTVVPDPTALLCQEDYFQLLGRPRQRDGYVVFAYVLTEREKCFEILEKVLEERPDSVVRLVTLRDDGLLTGDSRIRKVAPSPVEWMREIASADLVLTDSFHGTMLSLIFNRELFVVLKTGELHGNDRMLSVLETVGLRSRIVADAQNLGRPAIDWEDVNARLSAYRRVGIGFLRDSLSR